MVMKVLFFTAITCLLASAVVCQTTTAAGNTTVAANTTTAATTTANTTTVATTSAAPTTTVNTTVAPNTTVTTAATTTAQNTTTALNTTVPTTVTTTASTTPPPTDDFDLKENQTVCLKATLAAFFKVSYMKKDNTTGTATISIPKTAAPSGECAKSGVDPYLILKFDGITAQFNFSQKSEMEANAGMGRVYLSSVSFAYTEDPANFPNASDPKSKKMADNPSFDLKMSSNTTYFECKSPIENKVDDNVTLTFDMLKVQVYDVDGNYSGDGEICDADKSTTAPPTPSTTHPATTSVTPTLPSTPKTGNWSVKGKDGLACMMATMGARFSLKYKKMDNSSATAKFDLPDDAKTTGSTCENVTDSSVLQLEFFQNYMLQLKFSKKSSKSQLTADTDYYLENITLTYYETKDHFPDSKEDPTVAKMIGNNDEHFNVQLGKSYKCNSKVEIDMGDGNMLDTYNLQVEAFKSSNSTDYDEFTECTADNATSNIVPIAVGAALAALVVIVLIAYVIGRRRSRSGYESV